VGVYDWDAKWIEDYIASVEGEGEEIMPCYDPRSNDPEYLCEDIRKELNRVTRVACELALAIRVSDMYRMNIPSIWGTLNLSTQKWVREHEEVDKKRRK